MDIRTIKKLIELLKDTGMGEIEVESGEDRVRISAQSSFPAQVAAPIQPAAVSAPAPAPQPAAAAPQEPAPKHKEPEGHKVLSPMVGTAYLSSKPGAKPFVEVGQRIQAGETLCIIEAMKMFNQIEADKSGVISARLIDNAQPVEFDQPLFIIDAE